MKEDSKSILFVYGTLRKGLRLHHYLNKATISYVGEGSVQGQLYDLGSYPGAISTSAPARIKGEVYELSDSKELHELDKIEGFDSQEPDKSLFVRQMTTVELVSGENISAWVYFLPKKPKNGRLIVSGDYKQNLTDRPE